MTKLLLVLMICLCAGSAHADKYYMVLSNTNQTVVDKPALTRYIYDTDNPGQITPAPRNGQNGATLSRKTDLAFGGLVYYAGKIYAIAHTGDIHRFDAYTGENEGAIIKGLNSPQAITIGPDKNLYIATQVYIARYTLTGKPKPGLDCYGDVFAQSSKILYGTGITFDKDGNLIVSSQVTSTILHISGKTGNILRYWSLGSGVLTDVTYGKDGLFYATATGEAGLDKKGYVLVLNTKTGSTTKKYYADTPDPFGINFTPDDRMILGSYYEGILRAYKEDKPLNYLINQGPSERNSRIIFYRMNE
jgi:hypothetical protein